MVDGCRSENPVQTLDRRVRIFEKLRDRRLAYFLVQIDGERVQALAERLCVRLIETRQKRLGISNDFAGQTRRGRHVSVFGRPLECERRVFRRVEKVDREILLTRDARELRLDTQSFPYHLEIGRASC